MDSRSISVELNVLYLEIQLCVEWLTKDIEVQFGSIMCYHGVPIAWKSK